MKRLLLLLWATGAAIGAEINNGDSYEKVISVLGQPQGVMGGGGYKLLTYERGKVELQDGKVTGVKLMTTEQLDLKRADDARNAEEARRVSEARRVEGTAVREAKLQEPSFAAASAAERLAYWEWFRGAYPEVNVDGEYQAARAEVDESRRQQEERDLAVADLEARAASAEARANEAERISDQRDDSIYYDSWANPNQGVIIPVDRPDRPATIQRPIPARPRSR